MTWESVFNCLLIGKKSSGRASFIRHHIPRGHTKGQGCLSGVGVVMHPLIMNTSVGTIQFNIWDIDGMHGKCLVPTDCVIVFDGVWNGVSVKTSPTWQTDIVVVVETIKLIVACADEPFNSLGDLNTTWMEKTKKKSMQLDYYNLLSLESPHNVEKIFLWLSRKLLNDKKIEFFSYPVFLPRFFIKAQKAEQGICCHCFCVMVTNNDEVSSSSSSSSSSGSCFLKGDSTELKGGGDFKVNCQITNSKLKDEDDKEKENTKETDLTKSDADADADEDKKD